MTSLDAAPRKSTHGHKQFASPLKCLFNSRGAPTAFPLGILLERLLNVGGGFGEELGTGSEWKSSDPRKHPGTPIETPSKPHDAAGETGWSEFDLRSRRDGTSSWRDETLGSRQDCSEDPFSSASGPPVGSARRFFLFAQGRDEAS